MSLKSTLLRLIANEAKKQLPTIKKVGSELARKGFKKGIAKASSFLERKIGTRGKNLVSSSAKTLGKEISKASAPKIRQIAEKNKDKNEVTKLLYDEMFNEKNLLEEAINQLGRGRRRRKRKRLQRGGTTISRNHYYLPYNRSYPIEDIRYNRLKI